MNVIIDYKVGNLSSLQLGFLRVGMDTIITSNKTIIKEADVLILPGVGAFKDAMIDLENAGMVPLIKNHVKQGKLLFGVCLGMQLLFDSSDEFEFTKGLGLIKGNIKKLNIERKVPHMGWNTLSFNKQDNITEKIREGDYVYFVHSYYADTDQENVIAYTNYDIKIPAIIKSNNIIGMQFHPEKSGKVGLHLLSSIKELTI